MPTPVTRPRSTITTAFLVAVASCTHAPGAIDAGSGTPMANPAPSRQPPPEAPVETGAAGLHKIQPVVPPEPAPAPAPRLDVVPSAAQLQKHVDAYFQGHVGRRIYLQVDKPMYQPGESIWVKVWDLSARNLSGESNRNAGIRVDFISPKGAVVLTQHLRVTGGQADSAFDVPAGVQGGEYTLRATSHDGASGERPIIVNSYEAPRIKKTLEFVRKAYGEGDEVTATIEVKRPTGEPLARHLLTARVRLDEADLPKVELTTDEAGAGLVRFPLPKEIRAGDGLLTVLIEDGGITESISKRIPIIVKKLQFSFFPEGGRLIEGTPARLYFEARTPIGKPADVEGRIIDDLGNPVAEFATYKNGLGRLAFTPSTGRQYHAEITRPVGVSETYALPLADAKGCSLRSFDDLDGSLPALRVEVRCTEAQKVIVAAMLRENLLDVATVDVPAGQPVGVELLSKDPALAAAQGIARVTVFDEKLDPLAERLVYRNRRARLQVSVKPDKSSYSPRDPISLEVKTTDTTGKPVAADLAVAVVDDTVVSYADDKTGHLLSRLFLEPEIPEKVEEPNVFFDLTEEKSALAMDLLMGTRGYRRFEWQPVLHPRPTQVIGLRGLMGIGDMGGAAALLQGQPVAENMRALADEDAEGPINGAGLGKGMGALAAPRGAMPAPPPAAARPMAGAGGGAMVLHAAPQPMEKAVVRPMAQAMLMEAKPVQMDEKKVLGQFGQADRRVRDANELQAIAGGRPGRMGEKDDLDWAGKAAKTKAAPGWALVRVFAVPQYAPTYVGPRTDFRETIFWAPGVHTDANGVATVKFFASDAVTSFRAFTEGVGQGLAGRDETVFKSNLPFSLSVKLPLEVSAGDRPMLPVTLTNETSRTLDVSLDTSFGALLTLTGQADRGGALAAGARRSLFFPLEVTGVQGASEVKIGATTGGLSDEFTRTLAVTPLGFPQVFQKSGEVKDRVVQSVDLGAAIPGSIQGTIKLYTSPVATLVSGLDGILREPVGCFEQTSSANYPNVMVLSYLKEHDIADPNILARSTKLLDEGYKRLAGYEAPHKGYEWFGGDPGHEALTAYGLLEFADMKRVYGDVDGAMVERTAAWLKTRRNGNGGYLRDAKALDSFGRASPAVTDGYITYGLVMAGEKGLDKEVDSQAKVAADASDPYLLALAANTLLHTPSRREAGRAAAHRLASLQAPTGAWTGADHSITHSGGLNLDIETTSLAVLALLEAGGYDGPVRNAVAWLTENRGGFGGWGATQATVLALKAMTAYANASRHTQAPGSVEIRVNGEPAGRIAYDAGRREPLIFSDIARKLRPGANKIEILHDGEPLPYTLAVEYRSVQPASSEKASIGLKTSLERTGVKMGETVRLNAVVTNKTASGQPMTIARIGLPAGLTFQTWQLKELRENGVIAFYETRPREVIVYFRDMKPSEEKRIPIDLVATVPGHYTGPASSAYLYYNDEQKSWAGGLAADIQP